MISRKEEDNTVPFQQKNKKEYPKSEDADSLKCSWRDKKDFLYREFKRISSLYSVIIKLIKPENVSFYPYV